MRNEHSVIEFLEGCMQDDATDIQSKTTLLNQALESFIQDIAQVHQVDHEEVSSLLDFIAVKMTDPQELQNHIYRIEERIKDFYIKLRLNNPQEKAIKQIPVIRIQTTQSTFSPIEDLRIIQELETQCKDLEGIDIEDIIQRVFVDAYDGMPLQELQDLIILNTTAFIERDPQYSKLAARLLNRFIHQEVSDILSDGVHNLYQEKELLIPSIKKGLEAGLLDERFMQYNLDVLASALDTSKNNQFEYIGLKTLYDRYFLKINDSVIETPQLFFMRVAMGLGLNETKEREEWVIKFYQILSSFDFISSTPTLFNSGTKRPQLSSCFLNTCYDSLDSITEIWQENAFLSKWAGGIATDWTYVRGLGSHIKGTNGKATGLIPFLKVNNDIALAVNQGGKRRGSFASYLEIWHLDVEEFIQLRRNVGDERRRTLDMHTVAWIPDLFMQRVLENKDWTLFSPRDNYLNEDIDLSDLHDLYGDAFVTRYEYYETLIDQGKIKRYKKIKAKELWQRLLIMLFETGHPWITFKDPINVRNPQKHKGIIHSSNLCTEITLNTSESETAVCNLGSLNIVNHLLEDDINVDKLKKTIFTAIRMLDNVIDINYYPTQKTQTSNFTHRPIGLGIMGFHDSLMVRNIPYDSNESIDFADQLQELISYYAIEASCSLAKERGAYSSFKGSEWSLGNLPFDTYKMLVSTRDENTIDLNMDYHLNWDKLREEVKQFGMRNSHCMAIAPTATISNIVGVSPSIDPIYKQLHAASNLSGKFMMINKYLVKRLKDLDLWNEKMLEEIKINEGSIQNIDRIPGAVKAVFKNAFEMDTFKLIECGARRQKWIDQSQSLNIYVQNNGQQKLGAYLNDLYFYAWKKGLKTTYYLKTQGASSIEKSTVNSLMPTTLKNVQQDQQSCSILNGEDCEVCQ